MDENNALETNEAIELLSFRVGGEDYAIDIATTREIRGWSAPSPLPNAPEFVLGVISLRGVVLPLLDLAARLGIPERNRSDRNVVIVAEIDQTPVGLLVDAVSDIIAPTAEEMQSTPSIAKTGGPLYVRHLTLVGDKVVRILDLPAVVPPSAELEI